MWNIKILMTYNIENKLYNNYPWPNLKELKINEDFITDKKII